jgi:cytidylate kinase
MMSATGSDDSFVVAIDGPAGAGKSSAALALANRLGFVLLDTGALYRAVALAAKERGVSWDDGPALGALTAGLDLHFEADPDGGRPHVHLDGVDRSEDIRTPDISQGASQVSAHGEVRDALLGVQRRLGDAGRVVVEGRDTCTVVFPRADVKVYLDASVDVRTARRRAELEGRGIIRSHEEVRDEIVERDHRDMNRPVAPLRPAEDAVRVDSSDLDLEQVIARLFEIVARRRV